MQYETLKKGHRIEYTFIEEEQLKYAQTPVFQNKKDLNQRLKELHEDHSVQRAIVIVVRYFDKSE